RSTSTCNPLKQDIALAILRESGYDISSAVDKCNELEELRDLVSRGEGPLGGFSRPLSSHQWQVRANEFPRETNPCYVAVHHPSVIMNNLNRLGAEEDDLSFRGRFLTPVLLSEVTDENCPGRALRSSGTPIAPELSRKIGKRNNLAIAMVGFEQRKLDEDEVRTRRQSFPFIPIGNMIRSADRRTSLTTNQSSVSLHKKRVRSLNASPTIPSTIGDGLSSSASSLNSSSKKKRKNPLEIDMNWTPAGTGVRRTVVDMENGSAEEMKKKKEVELAKAALLSDIRLHWWTCDRVDGDLDQMEAMDVAVEEDLTTVKRCALSPDVALSASYLEPTMCKCIL
ncbi:hypothetical protein PENTCL1PPCAC_3778, partial [Pristionchus entomophagus]